jgi:hypothetical protein
MAKQPRQERIGFYGKFTPTALDTSESDKMRALAGLGKSISDAGTTIGQRIAKPMIEAKRAEEGAQAAEEAFKAGEEVKPIAAYKFGSSQYQAAAEQKTAELTRNAEKIYRSELSTESAQTMAGLSEQFKDDPVGFNDAAENYIKGTVSAITDPVLAADINDKLTRNALAAGQNIQSAFEVKQTNKNIVKLGNNISSQIRQANRLAREGRANEAASILENISDDQDSLADISPKFKAQLQDEKRKVKNGLYENKISGELDAIADDPEQGISAAYAKLDKLQSKVPKGYDPAEWDAFIQTAQTDLGRTNSRVQSAAAAATKKAEQDATNYVASVSAGFVVSEEETATVMAGVAGTKYEDAVKQAQEIAQYSLATAEERAELRAGAEALGLDGIQMLEAMNTQEDFINRAVQADAYGFAVRQGIVEEVEFDPLLLQDDPDTPENEYLANQANFQKRIEQSAVLTEQYGYAISPLSAPEARTLTNALPNLDRAQKIALADVFKAAPGIWGQIAGKGAGSYAQLSALGNKDVMNVAFNGQDKLAAGLVKPIKIDDFRNDFIEATGNVYGPEDSASTMQAALDYYYGSVETGSDVYDPSTFKDAIQAVTGGIRKVRGVLTQLPEGVEASDLEMYFDDMTAKDLSEAGLESTVAEEDVIGGSLVFPFVTREAETINKTLEAVHNGIIKAVPGENTYIITDPDTGFAIPGPDGITPFEFTIKQSDISKMQAKRNALINTYARSGISGAGVPISDVRP